MPTKILVNIAWNNENYEEKYGQCRQFAVLANLSIAHFAAFNATCINKF